MFSSFSLRSLQSLRFLSKPCLFPTLRFTGFIPARNSDTDLALSGCGSEPSTQYWTPSLLLYASDTLKREMGLLKHLRPIGLGPQWTINEDEAILVMASGGLRWDEIASRIRRPIRETRHRFHALKTLQHESRPWTDEEDASLVAMMDAGYEYGVIADQLHRSDKEVWNRFGLKKWARLRDRSLCRRRYQNDHRPWRPIDEWILVNMSRARRSILTISKALGRSEYCVERKFASLTSSSSASKKVAVEISDQTGATEAGTVIKTPDHMNLDPCPHNADEGFPRRLISEEHLAATMALQHTNESATMTKKIDYSHSRDEQHIITSPAQLAEHLVPEPCYNCGQYGHRQQVCAYPKTCHICRIPGHTWMRCSQRAQQQREWLQQLRGAS